MITYPVPDEQPKTAAEVQGALLVAAELDSAAESLKAHAESLTEAAVSAIQVLPMSEVQELSSEHRNELLGRLLAKGVDESLAKAPEFPGLDAEQLTGVLLETDKGLR